MERIEFTYKPFATYILIAANVIVFSWTAYYQSFTKDTGNMLLCVREFDQTCAKRISLTGKNVNFADILKCTEDQKGKGLSEDDCMYDFSDCFANKNIQKKCLSNADNLLLNYGFAASDISFLRPWTFITSMFMHANFMHLISNMMFLLFVGSFIESRLKVKKYLMLYFLSGMIGSLVSAYVFTAFDIKAFSIGASGGIAGLLGANLVFDFSRKKDEDTPMIFGCIPIYYGLSPVYLLVFFFIQIFSGIFNLNSGIGYIDHAAGFVIGVVLAIMLREREVEQDSGQLGI